MGFFLKYPNLKTGCAPSAPQRSLTILHAFEIKILFHDCYHSLILLPVWWTGSHFSDRTRQCRFPIPINEMTDDMKREGCLKDVFRYICKGKEVYQIWAWILRNLFYDWWRKMLFITTISNYDKEIMLLVVELWCFIYHVYPVLSIFKMIYTNVN